MHARELVELAAIVSTHGPALVRGTRQLSATSLDQYWTASKCRLDRWGRSLKAFAVEQRGGRGHRHDRWPRIRGVLEEIITGEVLTRVWTAVLAAHDRCHGGHDAEAIAHGVMIGHFEARHRALTLLVAGPAVDAEEAVKFNRLRRRSERWTDLLLGHLVGLDEVGRFAVDPQRAGHFAEDLQCRNRLQESRFAWPLLLASLRAAFATGFCRVSPNADLNDAIASSIVTCFQSGVFDSAVFPFRSLWLSRLDNLADDAQGLVDDLLGLDAPGAGNLPPSVTRQRRLRRHGL